MKCRHCAHRYSALQYDVAPGGTEPPGVFLALSTGLGVVAVVLFRFEVATWKWVALGLSALVLVQVPISMGDCRTRGTHPGGDLCPKCGGANRVWPWSI